MKRVTRTQQGYTLLELTFSIAFYTMIVTTALIGFIGIFGIYNKAQSITRTQEEARKAMDTLTRDLRQTNNLLAVTPEAGQPILANSSYCLNVGGQQVGYGLKLLTDKNHYVLVRSSTAPPGKSPCQNYDQAALVTSSDVWTDKDPFFPPTSDPFVIDQVSGTGGIGPVVWQVRFGVYRGVSAPTMSNFSVATDQFGAGTMLQSIVTSRE